MAAKFWRKYLPEMNAKELLRWIAALSFGGFGIYELVESFPFVTKWNGSAFDLAMIACMLLLLVVFPWMLAYSIFRRRYHVVCSVLAMLGAIVVWGILMGLPRRFHWHEFMSNQLTDSPILMFPFLGLELLFLFGPFFAAAWFYRFCMRLATRYIPPQPLRPWPAPAVGDESLPRDSLK